MTEITHDELEKQLAFEEEMVGLGVRGYWKRTNRALEKGRVEGTVPGIYLLKKVVEPFSKAIDAYLKEANSGRPGPRQIAAKYLEQLEPEITAYIAAKNILKIGNNSDRYTKTSRIKLSFVCEQAARGIEDELRYRYFLKQNKGLLRFTEKKLEAQNTSSPTHQRSTIFHQMAKADIEWDRWTRADCHHIGAKLVELFECSTGLIRTSLEYTKQSKKRHKPEYAWVIQLTESAYSWFDHQLKNSEILYPRYRPCLIPPKNWSTGVRGGYYSDILSKPIVTKIQPKQDHLLSSVNLDNIYRGLNALQNTAWSINEPVLTVAKAMTNNNVTIGDLTIQENLPLPNKPDDIAENEHSRKEWRTAAAKVHNINQNVIIKRMAAHGLLNFASFMLPYPRFYFPYRLDFRGRAYPIPTELNPQGNDLSKSLLQFANAKPLGTQEAVRWLAIHGANVWGNDKVSLDDRYKWVLDHSSLIVRNADDPFTEHWWRDADKPWCFLAFCFEWAGYHKNGLNHLTRLPVAMDGSCNGLQHFSAMLRDEVGGKAVNLTPSNTPQDIYKVVADKTLECLKDVSTNSDDGQARMMAETWLSLGVDRKITKRCVMVLPYGGTFMSCLTYVREAYQERLTKESIDCPFGDAKSTATKLLAQCVWASMGEVVIAARSAMDWLQKVSRVVSKAGLPIHWNTPTGFVAYQAILDKKRRRVKTKFNGSLIFFSILENQDKIDSRRQATSISPNFVHSMDASAMFLTVLSLLNQGVTDFAMVHDSYGTHATNAAIMAKAIRHTFVEMYSKDILSDFKRQVEKQLPQDLVEKLPELPPMGSLDLKQVIESDYFFA